MPQLKSDRSMPDALIDGFTRDFPDMVPAHRIPGLRARLGEMHDPVAIMEELVLEADLHMDSLMRRGRICQWDHSFLNYANICIIE